jgi:hypothetical protein
MAIIGDLTSGSGLNIFRWFYEQLSHWSHFIAYWTVGSPRIRAISCLGQFC